MKKELVFSPATFYPPGYTRAQALASVDIGWHGLVNKVFDKLESIKNIIIVIDQVKEKYGGLRIYSSPMHEEFDRFTLGLETESYKICETCGESGKLRGGGWYVTACDVHANGRPAINPF
jgi:hypothetical protein